jgi:hypothetical protein
MQTTPAAGDGANRAVANAEARRDLTLRKFTFADQTIDFLDEGGGEHGK